MAFPRSKQKHYSVDGVTYTACVNEGGYTADWGVKLNVAIRAEYGFKSICTVAGMENRSYWQDYPNFDPASAFSITPRVVCEIIRFAHANGWNPTEVKSNMRIPLPNDELHQLISRMK